MQLGCTCFSSAPMRGPRPGCAGMGGQYTGAARGGPAHLSHSCCLVGGADAASWRSDACMSRRSSAYAGCGCAPITLGVRAHSGESGCGGRRGGSTRYVQSWDRM
eukprot:scaffold2297_cov102-Isochrysis_galbana.AAC.16